MAAFAMALAVFAFVMIDFSDGGLLFSRPYWSDEIQTVMVASHASPAAVLSDLRHGADHGPSLLHLVVWGLRAMGVPMSPIVLRALALLCVWGALVVVYAILRRAWARDASVAGALAVGSHGLVVLHAFEARYYGPWLFLAALFAWCVSLPDARRRRRDVAIAALSVLLCSVHWFGVLTLGLMCAGAVVSRAPRWRDGLRLVAPAAAGVLVLLALIPLAVGQREMLTVPGWIPDFSLSQLSDMAVTYWVAMVPATAVAAFAVASVLSAHRDQGRSLAAAVAPLPVNASLLALTALLLLPVVLVAISLIGPSSTLTRYAIPAALGWAPIVALAAALLGRWPARAFSALLVVLWFVAFVRTAQAKRDFARHVDGLSQDFARARAAGIPSVVQSMHVLYSVTARDWPRPVPAPFLELSDSAFAALFPPGTPLRQANKGVIVQRDIARVHARRYGYPLLVPRATLDTTPQFLILFDELSFPRGYLVESFARSVFPSHRSSRVGQHLWLFERRTGGQ